jgi:O-antigen/teichoic acid export membrane protein
LILRITKTTFDEKNIVLGIVQRQALLNTIINYVGVVVGFVNIVVLFPMFLSEDEFGLTRLTLSLATAMAQLSSFGVHRIAVKFFPVYRTQEGQNNGLLRILFLVSMVGFALVAGIYFLIKTQLLQYYEDDSQLFADYYVWVPLSAFGLLLFIVLESFLQALRKTVFTNLLRNVIIRIHWLFVLLLYYWGYCTFFQFMILYLLGYFITSALCLVQLKLSNELSLDKNRQYTRKRLLKPLINYGLYSLLSGITAMLITNIDLLMIGALMPEDKLKNVGIYAVAVYIASVIYIPSNALSRIAAPIIAYDWKKRNLKKVEEFYKKSSLILIFLGGIIYGCIALNINEILSLLQPEFVAAKYVILILGAARLFDMAAGVNSVILVVTRFYRAETVIAILLVILVVVTNLIFIPIYGINGAAIATAGVFLFFNVVAFAYIQIKLKMHPFGTGTLYMLIFGVIAALIVYHIPLTIENTLLSIVLKSVFFAAIYALPVYFFKVSDDINGFVNKLIFRKNKQS